MARSDDDAMGTHRARLDEAGLTAWGRAIGQRVRTPVHLTLRGPLGAGKSVLARAVGRGAGVLQAMPSPTFNLLFRYPAASGRAVVHLDLYRLATEDEVWELGWSELGGPGEIVIVEWPERAGALLPPDRWEIELAVVEGAPHLREVTAKPVGAPPPLPSPAAAVGAPPA